VPGWPIGQQQRLGVLLAVVRVNATGRDGGGTIGAEAAAAGGDRGLAAIGANPASLGTCARRDRSGRSFAPPPFSGEGRPGRLRRWTLPMTALLDTPSRRPISAAECPSSQSTRKLAIISTIHLLFAGPALTGRASFVFMLNILPCRRPARPAGTVSARVVAK
jgi:hypothetical protein